MWGRYYTEEEEERLKREKDHDEAERENCLEIGGRAYNRYDGSINLYEPDDPKPNSQDEEQ